MSAGFSPTFPVNYNDMDYCLKLGAGGQRVVYDPDTVLHHFESSSRSADVEDWEKDQLLGRWLALTAVDPVRAQSPPAPRPAAPQLAFRLDATASPACPAAAPLERGYFDCAVGLALRFPHPVVAAAERGTRARRRGR